MEFRTLVPAPSPPAAMLESQDAAVAAGGAFLGELRTFPYPAANIHLQYGLTRPEGYSGDLGELSVRPHSPAGPCTYFPHTGGAPHSHSLILTGSWDFAYSAPRDVKSPIDIVANFSVFDPWANARRELAFTYHVSPSE